MNLVILTAALAILALLDNYSKNTMKELDYENLLLLRHSLIIFRYYKQAINNVFNVFCIVYITFALIIISSYSGNVEPNVPLKIIDITLIILVLPLLIYFYSAYINNSLIKTIHPIIRGKIISNKPKLSSNFSISAFVVGSIQSVFWFLYAELNFNNKYINIGIYIMTLILWLLPILLVFKLKEFIINKYDKKIKENIFYNKIDLSTNIKIYLKPKQLNKDYKNNYRIRPIFVDIRNEDIIVDKEKNILIFNRENFETIQKISLKEVKGIKTTTEIRITAKDLADCYNT